MVIACPMLEDELIHSIKNDSDDKNLYVLNTPYNSSLKRKLILNKINFDEINEWDFMNYNTQIVHSKFNIVIRMKNLALHAEPKDLMKDIENDLLGLQGHVDMVALYYGTCGNYGWDISKWAKDNLKYPVTVFRDLNGRVCDDCVCVSVGGLDKYRKLIKEFTGVMLFTPAIATNWMDFLLASDIMKGIENFIDTKGLDENEIKKHGIKWMLDLCGYKSVVQIDNGLEDRKDFDRATKEFAKEMKLNILQASHDYVDLGPANRLYSESKSLLRNY